MLLLYSRLFRIAAAFSSVIIMLLALGMVTTANSSSWAQSGSLSVRVPNDANAMVILNVDKIMASPIAQKENWREKREKASAAGLSILPPSATEFLMAAKLDLEFMHPVWEIALAKTNYEPSMPKVAAKWGGEIDRVLGHNAVMLPDDSCVVQLGPRLVASRRPANRQGIARWLRQTNTTVGHKLAPYMKKAIDYADKAGTPIILALDLEGAASAEGLQKRLATFESLKGTGVDVKKLAESLASVQGITLGLNVTDHVGGAMIIDFDGDTGPLKDVAKPLLLEVLSNQSAMIDEFQDWKAVVEPKRVRLAGRLYASGLQRILSILDAPATLQQVSPSAGDDDPQMAARLASQQCFKSVTGLVEDLREKPGVKTAGQVGIWWARYAEKIDKLPMLNVDEQLLDYRQYVSSALRGGSGSLRNVGGRSRVRQENAPAQYRTASRWGSTGYYGGYYGYRGAWAGSVSVESPRLEAQNRSRIRKEEVVRGAYSARQIMTNIDNATADIRRAMTEKFKAEF